MDEHVLFSAIVIGASALLAGITAGFVVSHRRMRTALSATCRSIARIRAKHRRRAACQPVSPHAEVTALAGREPTASGTAPDPVAVSCARSLGDIVRREYGDAVHAVYLFGSRARGDHVDTSDVDIAVVFEPGISLGARIRWRLLRAAFRPMMSHGLYLQVRPLERATFHRSTLYPVILREGLRI